MIALLVLMMASHLGMANQVPDRFYANHSIQSQAPAAFALQREGLQAVQILAVPTQKERKSFIMALRAQPQLIKAIQIFASLKEDERLQVLREVFAIEVAALGIRSPELFIKNDSIPGRAAYFDFDLANPDGTGKVILNPKELAKEKNPYTTLLLLIHETRHSAQLQLAHREHSPLARSYLAAFQAQKKITGFSFCDFTTLINEYEAFQFANYVVGALTNFQIGILDMGTFASQYSADGQLKIDLLKLALAVGNKQLLSRFNELEKEQYLQLSGPAR